MLTRVFVFAALVVALMVVIKDGRLPQGTGLFGSCTVVRNGAGEATDWRACRSGKLSGAPDLSRQSCKRWGTRARIDYWECAAAVSAAYRP